MPKKKKDEIKNNEELERSTLNDSMNSDMKSEEKTPDENDVVSDNKIIRDNNESVSEEYDDRSGRVGPIGPLQIREAEAILQRYKEGKSNLDRRIVQNEQWFRLRHWDDQQVFGPTRRRPTTSAWLFNSIANKHADAVDNYPAINVLPREQSDTMSARVLSDILPVIFEHNDYEEVYSQKWWYKLRTGSAVEGVFWDKSKNNGMGDISVKLVDLLNLFWEPGISDIQESRNVFNVSLVDTDLIEQEYPFMEGKAGWGTSALSSQYIHDDSVDTSSKSAVIDWYYKKRVDGKTVLHYCKFCNGEVLWASENHPDYRETGWYQHGMYPFVFDTLFPIEDTPVGFGYIDIMKEPQIYIDKMQTAILENTIVTAKKRHFVRQDSQINEEEYADLDKSFVHVSGTLSDDAIMEIRDSSLPSICVTVLNNKIDELKETSGNRDVNQGSTSSGVTAASAIAALQEAGSKLSRDMLKASYNAFRKVNILVVELIRQFYDEPRFFRIISPDGGQKFVEFDNSAIAPQSLGVDFGIDFGNRVPIFDFKVSAQKASPYSKVAQNELALQLYSAGFFQPGNADNALACAEMMDFDDKDKVIQKIQQNGTLLQMVQQLQQQVIQLTQALGAAQGIMIPDMPANASMQDQSTVPSGSVSLDKGSSGIVQNAKNATREAASPR